MTDTHFSENLNMYNIGKTLRKRMQIISTKIGIGTWKLPSKCLTQWGLSYPGYSEIFQSIREYDWGLCVKLHALLILLVLSCTWLRRRSTDLNDQRCVRCSHTDGSVTSLYLLLHSFIMLHLLSVFHAYSGFRCFGDFLSCLLF